jgi:predicted nucleotidyltransferase
VLTCAASVLAGVLGVLQRSMVQLVCETHRQRQNAWCDPMTPLTVQQIQQRLALVFDSHGIEKAILFGSYARGEASKHSDVDLILVKQTKQRFLDRYEGLLQDLFLALPGLAVDALVYTPDEFETMRQRRFLARALQEGKLIYES